jgi:outer membrane protein
LFLLLGLLPSVRLSAQEPLTLEKCLQQAFTNSHILRMADLGAGSARDKLAQSRAMRMPALTARGSYLRIGKVSSFSIPMGPTLMDFKFGSPNRLNAELGLGLPLFTWGRLARQTEIALIGIEIGDTDRRQKALEVTDQVLRAWYSALLGQKAIAATLLQLERAEKNLAITQTRFESGHASKLEILRAQVQAANARTQLDENRLNLEKANVWLAKVIGREGEVVMASGDLAFIPLRINADSLAGEALSRRYDLIGLRLQEQLLHKQIEITGNTLRPTVNGVAAWTLQNGFNPLEPEEFVDNWNVGLQLTFPLFDGGVTRHRVHESEKQLAGFQEQEKEIRELAMVQIRQAFIGLAQSEQKYLTQKENIDLAREALASAEDQYRHGLLSSLDLIAAQQALAESELMTLRALFAHTMARLDLCKASGDYSLSGTGY